MKTEGRKTSAVRSTSYPHHCMIGAFSHALFLLDERCCSRPLSTALYICTCYDRKIFKRFTCRKVGHMIPQLCEVRVRSSRMNTDYSGRRRDVFPMFRTRDFSQNVFASLSLAAGKSLAKFTGWRLIREAAMAIGEKRGLRLVGMISPASVIDVTQTLDRTPLGYPSVSGAGCSISRSIIH